jgi:hypothetical protein
MIIEIDYNSADYAVFNSSVKDSVYRILKDFWEDCDEWCWIEITDPETAVWIREQHPKWIINDRI